MHSKRSVAALFVVLAVARVRERGHAQCRSPLRALLAGEQREYARRWRRRRGWWRHVVGGCGTAAGGAG